MSNRSESNKTMSQESQELAKQIEAIREDLSNLSSTVSRMTRAGVSEAQDMAREKVGEAQDAARESAGEVEAMVRRNPLQAALIAVGLGFAIGIMARR